MSSKQDRTYRFVVQHADWRVLNRDEHIGSKGLGTYLTEQAGVEDVRVENTRTDGNGPTIAFVTFSESTERPDLTHPSTKYAEGWAHLMDRQTGGALRFVLAPLVPTINVDADKPTQRTDTFRVKSQDMPDVGITFDWHPIKSHVHTVTPVAGHPGTYHITHTFSTPEQFISEAHAKCGVNFDLLLRGFMSDRREDQADALSYAFHLLLPVNDARPKPCSVPPEGWYCTLKAGHEGPCAAHPAPNPSFGPIIDKRLDGWVNEGHLTPTPVLPAQTRIEARFNVVKSTLCPIHPNPTLECRAMLNLFEHMVKEGRGTTLGSLLHAWPDQLSFEVVYCAFPDHASMTHFAEFVLKHTNGGLRLRLAAWYKRQPSFTTTTASPESRPQESWEHLSTFDESDTASPKAAEAPEPEGDSSSASVGGPAVSADKAWNDLAAKTLADFTLLGKPTRVEWDMMFGQQKKLAVERAGVLLEPDMAFHLCMDKPFAKWVEEWLTQHGEKADPSRKGWSGFKYGLFPFGMVGMHIHGRDKAEKRVQHLDAEVARLKKKETDLIRINEEIATSNRSKAEYIDTLKKENKEQRKEIERLNGLVKPEHENTNHLEGKVAGLNVLLEREQRKNADLKSGIADAACKLVLLSHQEGAPATEQPLPLRSTVPNFQDPLAGVRIPTTQG